VTFECVTFDFFGFLKLYLLHAYRLSAALAERVGIVLKF
jgi:hypothetical protein